MPINTTDILNFKTIRKFKNDNKQFKGPCLSATVLMGYYLRNVALPIKSIHVNCVSPKTCPRTQYWLSNRDGALINSTPLFSAHPFYITKFRLSFWRIRDLSNNNVCYQQLEPAQRDRNLNLYEII